MKKLIITVVVMTMLAAGAAIAQGWDYQPSEQGVADEQHGPGGRGGSNNYPAPSEDGERPCRPLPFSL